MTDSPSNPHFDASQRQAEDLLNGDPERLDDVLDGASHKADANRGRLRDMWEEIQLLIAMVRAYRSGIYRRVPWKVILMAVAAILYFLSPIDLIPDILGVFGFADDIAVVGLVAGAIRDELDRFRDFLLDTREDG